MLHTSTHTQPPDPRLSASGGSREAFYQSLKGAQKPTSLKAFAVRLVEKREEKPGRIRSKYKKKAIIHESLKRCV
jgi:hypothetical protein